MSRDPNIDLEEEMSLQRMQELGLHTVDPTNVPKIGDGCTIICWSDGQACTVVKVSKTGKTIWIQEDRVLRIDDNGESGPQVYCYDRYLNGSVARCMRRKDGHYRVVKSGCFVIIGTREHYVDPHF